MTDIANLPPLPPETAPRERRSQAERRALSEHGLLIAAAETIVDEGFAAATFDRISQRAGYSRGLVTQRFGSRDGLFVALIAFLSDRMKAHHQAAMDSHAEGDALSAYVSSFLQRLADDRSARAYFVLLAAAIANRLPQARHFFEHHERVKAELAAMIHERQLRQSLDPGLDPVVAATAIGALLMGIAMQLLLEPGLDILILGQATLDTLRLAGAMPGRHD